MSTIVEGKFDKFAADFFCYLALRYNLRNDFKVKVVHSDDHSWKMTVPAKLRETTENNTQFQHCVLTFAKSNGKKPSRKEKKLGLSDAGFTTEQVELFSQYDALIAVNFDQPIRTPSGEAYLWNLLISHHLIHVVELLTNLKLITEPATEHNYEARDAVEHLNRFVAWITLDDFIDRYVPTKD
jgi:hypothetical protein